MEVKVKKLHPDAILPTRATEGSACWDVYSVGDYKLWWTNITPIRTGLAFEVPPGYFLDIRPRSGLSIEGMVICNSPGTLDSDYRGELSILARSAPSQGLDIKKGQRIAQVRLEKVIDIDWVPVEELNNTVRGAGGFGSTGK